ncbi:MAG: CPBP family intramembrane metalloprotease [Planctomycetes bacterium]|nr:CPBP family intramembrane metalloprotease [Planctomycetota bacterium]
MQARGPASERTIVAATFGGLAPVALALRAVHRLPWRDVPRELGFDRSPVVGLGAALVLTLPMALGFALLEPGLRLDEASLAEVRRRPWAFLQGWAGAGLVEEALFRGFLFRQLVLRARWPDGRALALVGVLFGLLHIPSNLGAPAGELAAAGRPAIRARMPCAWGSSC